MESYSVVIKSDGEEQCSCDVAGMELFLSLMNMGLKPASQKVQQKCVHRVVVERCSIDDQFGKSLLSTEVSFDSEFVCL